MTRTRMVVAVVAFLVGMVLPTTARADSSCTIWFLCPPTPPAPAGSFVPQGPWAGGSAPWMLEKGDVNADGKVDLVATNWLGGDYGNGDSGLQYYLNTTTQPGSITFAGPFNLDIGYWGQDVRLADLTGTGRLDIVASTAIGGGQGLGELSVFQNLTPPGAFMPVFAPRQTFDAGRTPETISVADVNSDGKLDLATANYFGTPGVDGVSILMSTSTGRGDVSFTAPQNFDAIAALAQGVVLGDLDGDAKPEIAVADSTFFFGTTVAILKNNTPDGSLTAQFGPPRMLIAGIGPSYLSMADLNNDTRLDLAVSNLYDFIDYGISVFMNTTPAGASDATFTSQTRVRADLAQPALHAHMDLNSDGKRDIITSNWGNHAGFGLNLDFRGHGVSVLINETPDGSMTPRFADPLQLETPTGTWDVAHADFDGDGIQDIATNMTNTSPFLSDIPVPGNCVEPCGMMVFINHLPQHGVSLPPLDQSWLKSDYYCPLIFGH